VPFLWVPFSQNRTLSVGNLYNIRFHQTGGGSYSIQCSARGDSSFAPSARDLSWEAWEQQRTVPWTAWEDSRGCMVSSNGGASWNYFIGRLSPVLFKCV
jgi:hypothetical protein